jgi:hypothetical protein
MSRWSGTSGNQPNLQGTEGNIFAGIFCLYYPTAENTTGFFLFWYQDLLVSTRFANQIKHERKLRKLVSPPWADPPLAEKASSHF